MFRIEIEPRPRLLFSVGDRDLALALADLEGFCVVARDGQQRDPLPIGFFRLSHSKKRRGEREGSEPEQIAPGTYSYLLRKKKTQVAQT